MVAQYTQTCDITAFQGNVSAPGGPYPALACQTCVFPTYARVNGLDTTIILQADLSNKWIYFLGDSTTKQLHEQFLAYLDEPQTFVYPGEEGAGPPLHDWVKQPGRCDYVPPPYDDTQCQYNQLRCNSLYSTSRLGSNVRVTYDWKHFMYEDYDRTLFNDFAVNTTPHILVTSPGTHDCMHYPAEYYHHGLQMRRFAQHMHMLNTTVVWVDTTPFSTSYATGLATTSDVSTLSCVDHVNQVAYDLARELGYYLFSRQSLILSGNFTENGQYPLHQTTPVMREEFRILLAWLGCIQHDSRFASF